MLYSFTRKTMTAGMALSVLFSMTIPLSALAQEYVQIPVVEQPTEPFNPSQPTPAFTPIIPANPTSQFQDSEPAYFSYPVSTSQQGMLSRPAPKSTSASAPTQLSPSQIPPTFTPSTTASQQTTPNNASISTPPNEAVSALATDNNEDLSVYERQKRGEFAFRRFSSHTNQTSNDTSKQPSPSEVQNPSASSSASASTHLPNTAPASASAQTVQKISTSTQLVPKGTFLTVLFQNKLDARITAPGEPFTAQLTDDFRFGNTASASDSKLVLPAGTVIRGRVESVRRPSFFSKGGSIGLAFDHAVLPTGDLMPLELHLSPNNTLVNRTGNLYADPGIPHKLNQGLAKGAATFGNITQMGIDAGRETADGLGGIVTVPLAVVGAAIAGTAVTTGNAAVALVGKGETVEINPGDTIDIDFGNAFALPSED